MESSNLNDIHWVLDDALKFAQREVNRGNIYKGNFENYDFSLKIPEALKSSLGDLKINPRKFDMIWMNHVLEHRLILRDLHDLHSARICSSNDFDLLFYSCLFDCFIFKHQRSY